MRRFLPTLMLFFAATLVYYGALTYGFGNLLPIWLIQNLRGNIELNDGTYSRMQEIDQYRDIDVLLAGSSHFFRGFDPRLFEEQGMKVFVLASSGQSPLQAELLLERHLKDLNPKCVVLEASLVTYSTTAKDSTLVLLGNVEWGRDMARLIAPEVVDIRMLNALIYQFVRRGIMRNGIQPTSYSPGVRYIPGGYIERDIQFFDGAAQPPDTAWVEPAQEAALKRILQLCEKMDIPVCLVQLPVASAFYHSMENREKFDALISGYGDYYNFNTLMTLDDTIHFHDKHHLNVDGAKAFFHAFTNHLTLPERFTTAE